MELADQGRQEVARLQIEVVPGTVQIRGHEGQILGAILAIEAAAQLDAGDLGDGIGTVGLFQGAGEKVLLLERLRGELGVDAGAAKEDEALHPCPERLVDHVEFDGQVLLDELVGVLPVGEDAADPGRGDDHDLGPLLGEELPGPGLIGEIEFFEGSREHVLVSASP